MVRIISVIFFLLIATPAPALDLVCTVPPQLIGMKSQLCEDLRQELRVRFSQWTDSNCASEYLRRGLLADERDSKRNAARKTVNDDVNNAVDQFLQFWPVPTAARCGDGELDQEFGEECDDGNTTNNDGCSESCENE